MELTPDFAIVIGSGETFPKDRVLSIHTHDEAGIISDSCEIILDDFDGALKFPNTEAKIELSLGYKETGLTKIGTYFVKEIFVDGARHTVRIQCNAAPKAMRSQVSKTNEGGLRNLVNQMSGNFDLESAFDDSLDEMDLEDFPQFAESDMNYVTRLAQKNGAVAKPVDGHLVLANADSGKSVSGKSLPTKYIDATDVAGYSCVFKETESGGGSGTVYVNWYDKNTGEYYLEHAGEGAPEIELKEIFATKEQALAAARAKFKRTSKENKTLRFSTAGRTDLFAESPLVLHGFSQKIPVNWIISHVEHQLSSNGFLTSVDCVGGN